MSGGAAPSLGVRPAPVPAAADARLRWVHDPDDDQACLRHVTALHDLGAGRVVCHPTPGASWPILIRDLLESLGKPRDALARARRPRDGAALVRVWMRAERVEHLVVLRAHRLPPPLLDALAELATATGAAVWLIWHAHERPGAAGTAMWPWPQAVAALATDRRSPRPDAGNTGGGDIYRDGVAEARREARLWRIAPPRQHRYTQPGCQLGALLQRLTIDASTPVELGLLQAAAQAGFAAEGLDLLLPGEPAALAALGPRVTDEVMTGLRRLACPTSAAALVLALLTDASANCVASVSPGCLSPDLARVRTLPGIYRVPPLARPVLRAALLDHQAQAVGVRHHRPDGRLFRDRDGDLRFQRMSNLIRYAAALAGLPPPRAATSRHRFGLEEPFAAAVVDHPKTEIIGAGPFPTLRLRLPFGPPSDPPRRSRSRRGR